MTTKDELHQVVNELDEESAEEALAYMQSLGNMRLRSEPRIDDVTEPNAERAAPLEAWEDEGGGQLGHAVNERRGRVHHKKSPMTIGDDLHHLVDELEENSAEEALAFLQLLRRPRLLSEADIDDVAGTEEEQAEAVEAWQLDRRHALDER
jgi:uncharacterized protein YPO0396